MALNISGVSSLGNVFRESNRITNSTISFSVPTTSTAGTRNINLLGKKRIITLLGKFTGTNAQIASFIADLESWVNSGIQSTRVLTSSFGATYNVICTAFEWDYTTDSVQQIIYILETVQGGTIS